jgi:hypothetical protein
MFRSSLSQLVNHSVENDIVKILANQGNYPTIHLANLKLRLEDFIQGTTPTASTFK